MFSNLQTSSILQTIVVVTFFLDLLHTSSASERVVRNPVFCGLVHFNQIFKAVVVRTNFDGAVRRQNFRSVAERLGHSPALCCLLLVSAQRNLPFLLSWRRLLDAWHLFIGVNA